MIKPHKGTILGSKLKIPGLKDHPELGYDKNLGYIVRGYWQGHPQFGFSPGHTSLIVKKGRWKDGKCEIETLNSRYTWKLEA